MKRFILALPLFVGTLVFAQKFEATVSYGTASVIGLGDQIYNDIGRAIQNKDLVESQGVLAVSVMMYNADQKWRYGIDATIESFAENDGLDGSFISFIPKVDYFWNKADSKFRLYSGVGIGVTMRNNSFYLLNEKIKTDDTQFAFNITPIGVRYGGDFGVFVESNVGNKGILQGGVSYIF